MKESNNNTDKMAFIRIYEQRHVIFNNAVF